VLGQLYGHSFVAETTIHVLSLNLASVSHHFTRTFLATFSAQDA